MPVSCLCHARRIKSLCRDQPTNVSQFVLKQTHTQDIEQHSVHLVRLPRGIHSAGCFSGHHTNSALCGGGWRVAVKELTLCLLWVCEWVELVWSTSPGCHTTLALSQTQSLSAENRHRFTDNPLFICHHTITSQTLLLMLGVGLDYHYNYRSRACNPKPIQSPQSRTGWVSPPVFGRLVCPCQVHKNNWEKSGLVIYAQTKIT